MPGPITHLKAAYIYGEMFNIEDKAALYLGAIVPDSVNVYGHAPKEMRWPAHLRHGDLNVWLNNAKEFYIKYKDTLNNDYLLGYIIHIVTDIVWDKYFDDKLYSLIPEDINEDKKTTRWNEIYGFEQKQLKLDWAGKMLKILKQSKPISISTLTPELIDKMKQSVINNEISKGREPKVLDDNFMNPFFIEVVKVMQNIINS